ncbi:hypothetical protein D9619_010290 [Psilocybe cf. subviscida]|uniref:Uncharacterized protein n=1 Tax=Psilocybe cf. subviscida TaxID=2480587 RepID=A0A8H5ASS7_9AGAR|nr:hypothetical protein D9619_010290 [Psilocybe cf. subviscida]
MLASLFDNIEEFLLTGLVSLGLIVATIRASVTEAGSYVEAAGFSGFFMFCFALAMGIYVYVSLRSCFCNGDEGADWDEEEAIMVQAIHTPSKATPVVFLTQLGEPVIRAKPCRHWDGKNIPMYWRKTAVRRIDFAALCRLFSSSATLKEERRP